MLLPKKGLLSKLLFAPPHSSAGRRADSVPGPTLTGDRGHMDSEGEDNRGPQPPFHRPQDAQPSSPTSHMTIPPILLDSEGLLTSGQCLHSYTLTLQPKVFNG